MNNFLSKLEVSEEEWYNAQKYESEVWKNANKKNSYFKVFKKFVKALLTEPNKLIKYIKYGDYYCGDDWNFWWLEQFEEYKMLPNNLDRVLEVGCGPYTNIRLIAKKIQIKEIYCCDPLIDVYKTFKLTWLSSNISKNRIKIANYKCEDLKYENNYFDLVVCINVLDHVSNALKCIREIIRVTKNGGYIVFGQELSDDDDIKRSEVVKDVGHPVLINQLVIDNEFGNVYKSILKKILKRSEGREPDSHCGTYIFIGQKK